MKNPRATKLESLDVLEGFDDLPDEEKAKVQELFDKLQGMICENIKLNFE